MHARLAMATHNDTDNVMAKGVLCAGEASREEYTEAQEREDRGTDVGDWGGLGNYLWELTLERSNFAKRRRERAT